MEQIFVQSLLAGALLTTLWFTARALARRRDSAKPAPAPGRPLTCVAPHDLLGP